MTTKLRLSEESTKNLNTTPLSGVPGSIMGDDSVDRATSEQTVLDPRISMVVMRFFIFGLGKPSYWAVSGSLPSGELTVCGVRLIHHCTRSSSLDDYLCFKKTIERPLLVAHL